MARNQRPVGESKSETVAALPLACTSEKAAVEFIERTRWGNGPRCPRCQNHEVYQMRDRKTGERSKRYLWRCRACGDQYTARTGTVFEDSRIPLRHWCYAFWAACAGKKGVAAKEVQRVTGLSYKSSLFLLHRVRYAMADDVTAPPKLTGTIEVDETWCGGKPRYVNRENRATWMERRTPVVALIQRDGSARAFVVERVDSRSLKSVMRANIHPSARIMTDESAVYPFVEREFSGGHFTVNHSRREYARGDVTTNRAEGFFSILKRGLNGVYHSVSKQHLHRYIAEFQYRYNTRKLEDGERTRMAIMNAQGKRLMYREPA